MEVLKGLLALKNLLSRQGKESVTLSAVTEAKVEHLWKVAQRAFAGSNIAVVIRQPKGKEVDSIPPSSKKTSDPRRRPPRKAILVKSGDGKSFADILRQLKSSVNVKESGVQIQIIRETKGGDIILSLKRGQSPEQAESLVREIKEKVAGATVSTMTGEEEVTLQIMGIDGVNSEAEVEEALIDVVGLSKAAERKLVKAGRIQIGWITCRVRERVAIRKCYRCWGTGHLAAQCSRADRRRDCLRCGQTGHIARE